MSIKVRGKDPQNGEGNGEGPPFSPPPGPPPPPWQRETRPVYLVHVWHVTGQTFTDHNGATRKVLEPQTSFGYYLEHEGALFGWNHKLTGPGLVEIAPNFYKISIPDNGTATVTTQIEARETSMAFNEPMLKRGDQGDAVRLLQTCLHGHSQHFGPNHVHDPGPIDGIFGPRTEDSLRSFQANVGSGPVDGVAGPITWSQLDERDTRFPAADLLRGASGNPVRHLQRLLFAAAEDPGPVDGIYGENTAAAVRDFQQKQSLPQTGDADGQTRILLSFVSG